MTRPQLWALNIFLTVLLIGATWWAVNAPRAARPLPAPLQDIALQTEKPPLPPTALSLAPRDSADGVGRRPIFAVPAELAETTEQRSETPLARGVLPPLAAAPRRDLDSDPELKTPPDPFGLGKGVAPPGHTQFFGGHLISPETRRSDQPGGAPPSSDGRAPISAPPPVPSPRGAAGSKAESLSSSSSPAASTGPTVVSAPVDGLILLGVFRSRGKDRALIRTPSGDNLRLEQGDEVGGWRIYAIGDGFVELRRASQTRMLRMPQ